MPSLVLSPKFPTFPTYKISTTFLLYSIYVRKEQPLTIGKGIKNRVAFNRYGRIYYCRHTDFPFLKEPTSLFVSAKCDFSGCQAYNRNIPEAS